jgi:hypothetical protein
MRGMSKKTERAQPLLQLQRQYERLRRPLGQIGYITQGSVQDRTRRQGGGAGYQWTRKLARKTVTVALTAEQFECMKEALSNYRMLRRRLKQMDSSLERSSSEAPRTTIVVSACHKPF